ncbi:hypothetical protein NDU88_004714 [Pleurodeles waltl]|uniref:Uncharacterized protein n=1 Tax=Pleurodeles waltl TaxID=8319 RepID=A0AAV7QCT2_PLEWA|nr:hypothetical protein NDU88_004714 [Pleurodeles waltl]
MLHNLALRRHVPFRQEAEEAGDARVAALDSVDSEDEEAEDEDNRTAVIQQYFKWHTGQNKVEAAEGHCRKMKLYWVHALVTGERDEQKVKPAHADQTGARK